MEYDVLNLDIVLNENINESKSNKNGKNDIEIQITPEEYLLSITEEKLQKSQEFHNKINEHHAKAISEAYSYVVF